MASARIGEPAVVGGAVGWAGGAVVGEVVAEDRSVAGAVVLVAAGGAARCPLSPGRAGWPPRRYQPRPASASTTAQAASQAARRDREVRPAPGALAGGASGGEPGGRAGGEPAARASGEPGAASGGEPGGAASSGEPGVPAAGASGALAGGASGGEPGALAGGASDEGVGEVVGGPAGPAAAPGPGVAAAPAPGDGAHRRAGSDTRSGSGGRSRSSGSGSRSGTVAVGGRSSVTVAWTVASSGPGPADPAGTPWSISRAWDMVGRSAGSRDSSRISTGASAPARTGAGTSELATRASTTSGLPSVLNGGCPSTAKYSVAPSDHTSDDGAGSAPRAVSGAT